MKYLSLAQLEVRRPYDIIRVADVDRFGNILLTLRGGGNAEKEFQSLLFRNVVPLYQEAVRQHNGIAVGLNLIYCGYTNFDGSKPIIRISGRRFTRYLV